VADYACPQHSAPREGAPAENGTHRIAGYAQCVLSIEQFDNLGNVTPPESPGQPRLEDKRRRMTNGQIANTQCLARYIVPFVTAEVGSGRRRLTRRLHGSAALNKDASMLRHPLSRLSRISRIFSQRLNRRSQPSFPSRDLVRLVRLVRTFLQRTDTWIEKAQKHQILSNFTKTRAFNGHTRRHGNSRPMKLWCL
jgi:hypothetical protein